MVKLWSYSTMSTAAAGGGEINEGEAKNCFTKSKMKKVPMCVCVMALCMCVQCMFVYASKTQRCIRAVGGLFTRCHGWECWAG